MQDGGRLVGEFALEPFGDGAADERVAVHAQPLGCRVDPGVVFPPEFNLTSIIITLRRSSRRR